MAPTRSNSKDTMHSGHRMRTMRAWDDALDTLNQAATAYIKQTAVMFQRFTAEEEPSGSSNSTRTDVTVDDGLSHIDRRLERLAALEMDLHQARVGLQVRPLCWVDSAATLIARKRIGPPQYVDRAMPHTTPSSRDSLIHHHCRY